MNRFLKMLFGLLIVFLLTGCIGEDYNNNPPTVTITTVVESNDEQSFELKEANVDWISDEYDKKETEDILAFAREERPVSFKAGQKVEYDFDSQDFALEELVVSLWRSYEGVKLAVNEDRSFYFPKEKGEYVVVFNMQTDRGTAEYVGNILIE